MAEYIDRQEVIKKLEELDSRLMRGRGYGESYREWRTGGGREDGGAWAMVRHGMHSLWRKHIVLLRLRLLPPMRR